MMPLHSTILIDRFWSRVEKTSSCWLYIGAKDPSRYGRLRIGPRKWIGAHRFSWEITFGSIPCNLLVLHHCDVRHCVNPEHLFLGTHKDNSDDKIAKGRERYLRGLDHPRPKAILTIEQVREIRLKSNIFARDIAQIYGVSKKTIENIRHKQKWKYVL